MTAPPGSARRPREPETLYTMRAVLARSAALGAGALALAAAPRSRAAEPWPERAVRLVCAGAPGSSPDVAARLYAERLSARWGRPVPVESRPGADGTLAAQHALAQRDGHTLLFTFIAALTVAPLLHDRLPFDPVGDLAPISSGAGDFAVVAAAPGLPVSGLADLVELAQRRPGALNWASGSGDIYMAFHNLVRRRGLDMNYVSYRTPAPALGDLAEGRLDAAVMPLATALPQVAAGRMRVLAVANPARSPAAPDVPTAAEAGFPEMSFEGVLGFFAPNAMPAALRERIAADVRAVVAEPEFRARLQGLGMTARADTPAGFAAVVDANRSHWAEVARVHGAKPER
jgi:tripartite-type tricarboxylate transporter receptor subunit TctC